MKIIFPDNSIKIFENNNITGFEIAESISKSLAKDAIAVKVNGKLQDLSSKVEDNSTIEIIKDDSAEGIEILRHDTAHILAQAIKRLYPDAQITIGPVIENGFYYDILVNPHITLEDFPKIENEMQKIIDQKLPLERLEWSRDEAIKYFKSIKEDYKAEIIASIPQNQIISLYKQGDFIDLCRGPHAPHTGKVKAFKLLKLAGAYWRGDSNNEMLQRIYGTAWASKKQLNEYLNMLEEAKKRDHRKIGKEMELFHIQEEAMGQIFWHEKGYRLYRKIEEYIRKKLSKYDYKEIKTPQLMDKSFWEKSGHWQNFSHAMFTTKTEDGKTLALKPMNCPGHVQVFNSQIRSYKDLPLRMAEFGCCHRYEPSGALHGLMRVRGFVQDDAHIFCTKEQITEETLKFCNLLKEVYEDFGFKEFEVKFSDRPITRSGSDEVWDQAEEALTKAVKESGLEYTLNPGEGAFYGPKLEFVLKDCLGRHWQCGTLQVDFILPERLDANYIGSDGNKHRPVMLHRAVLGSLERFIGVLIEEFAGKFPLWLSPIHAMILPITNDFDDYAIKLKEQLTSIGAYADVDLSGDKVNYKIRKYSLEKIPMIMVVGAKEVENNTVSIRKLGSEKSEMVAISQLLSELEKEIKI